MMKNMLCALQSSIWLPVDLKCFFVFLLNCTVLSYSHVKKGPLKYTWGFHNDFFILRWGDVTQGQLCWVDLTRGLTPAGLSKCLSCVSTGFNNVLETHKVNTISCGCGKVNLPFRHIHQLLYTGLQSGASGEVQWTSHFQGNCFTLFVHLFWSLVDGYNVVIKRSLWSKIILKKAIAIKYPALFTPVTLIFLEPQ